MAINFPTSLDNFTNPVSTDTTTAVDHAVQHSNVNDAVEALEAKVGVNSSAVTTSHDYKLGEVTSSDKAVGKTATQTLTNKTLASSTNTFPTNLPKIIVKTSDQSVADSATLVSDSELQWTVASGTTYYFRFELLVSNNNSATPDWKSAILAPATSTGNVVLSGTEPAGGAFPQAVTTDVTTPGTLVNPAIVADASIPFQVVMQGWVTAGGNGTLAMQFAENTAGAATSITVLKGSRVTYTTA